MIKQIESGNWVKVINSVLFNIGGVTSLSRQSLFYPVAIVIGLGFARLIDTVILYSMNDNLQVERDGRNGAMKRGGEYRRISNNVPDDTNALLGGHLFQLAPVASSTPEAASLPPVDFSLIGTLEGDPSFARAVLRLSGSSEQPMEYAIGSMVGSSKIVGIGREKIWILINGKKVKVEVGENLNQVNQPSAEQSSPAAGTITKVLTRQEVNEKILGNPNAIYQGASFGPNLVDGKIDGYKIHKVNPGHIFYELGARSGDIVKSVNGYQLSDTERMFELWKSIKTMPSADVVILRNGQIINYNFQIRN